MILLQYAKEHRFPNPTFFVDDGYSGTNYDRPGDLLNRVGLSLSSLPKTCHRQVF